VPEEGQLGDARYCHCTSGMFKSRHVPATTNPPANDLRASSRRHVVGQAVRLRIAFHKTGNGRIIPGFPGIWFHRRGVTRWSCSRRSMLMTRGTLARVPAPIDYWRVALVSAGRPPRRGGCRWGVSAKKSPSGQGLAHLAQCSRGRAVDSGE